MSRTPTKIISTTAEIEAAAAAIANARAARRGAPKVENVLDVLKRISNGKLYDEVMEDAREALRAAYEVRRASGSFSRSRTIRGARGRRVIVDDIA